MVRDHGANSDANAVEHYIDIPPSAHPHRVYVSSSPNKHVISIERYGLQSPTPADKDTTSISARLEALSLRSRPNGARSASPRKREEISPSPPPVCSDHPERQPVSEPVVDAHDLDDTPIDEGDYIPVHLRWTGGPRNRASYAVPQDIRDLYPPDNRDQQGWKGRRYYVVVRGYETGIFYDFWGRIKPFGFVTGAMVKGFDRFDSAKDFWLHEEDAGHVKVLHRCDHN